MVDATLTLFKEKRISKQKCDAYSPGPSGFYKVKNIIFMQMGKHHKRADYC